MKVRCPECEVVIRLRPKGEEARPGQRIGFTCPSCDRRLRVVVPKRGDVPDSDTQLEDLMGEILKNGGGGPLGSPGSLGL